MTRPASRIVLLLLAIGCLVAADAEPGKKTAKPKERAKSRADVNAEAKFAYRKLPPEVRQAIDKAVKALVADAKAITDLESDEPCFTRPHPAVKGWRPDMALPAAIRMRDKFTGNVNRDTFIRWHLMWVVSKAEESDRKQITQLTAQLVNSLPGDRRLPFKRTYRNEPADAYQKWAALYGQVRLIVGYPPFQSYVGPPESLELMSKGRRKEAEKVWKECQKLEGTWERIDYPEARAHNERVGRANHIMREYQGELIGHLLRSGDPRMLKRVMRLIDKHAREESIIGFDLLTYLYLAAFDGDLQQYDPKALRDAGLALEKTAKATKGDWVPFGHTQRNFADYAFHMTRILKEGDTSEME